MSVGKKREGRNPEKGGGHWNPAGLRQDAITPGEPVMKGRFPHYGLYLFGLGKRRWKWETHTYNYQWGKFITGGLSSFLLSSEKVDRRHSNL